MTRAMIVSKINNAHIAKNRMLQKNGQERKTAFMKRCGHAAHVDFDGLAKPAHKLHNRLDFFRGASLAAELHMPTASAAIFASLETGKITTRNLCRKEELK